MFRRGGRAGCRSDGLASKFRIALSFRALGAQSQAPAVAHIQPTDPKNNVFGDVGSVVGDTFQVTGGQNELQAGADKGGLLGHSSEQIFKDAVAILIYDI